MPASPSVLFARLTSKARLKHLQLLAFIGELDSLQRAASMVGMSQPAATHALAELESVIGATLFDRHSRGMRPTAVGRALLPHVRGALRAMQEAAEAVAATQMGTAGVIRVASISAGISSLLASALPRFTADHPQLMVDVSQITADDLLARWDDLGFDLMLCRPFSEFPSGSRFVPLLSDRYCVVARPGHVLAGRASIPIDELHAETWLMQPPRSIASRDFYALWESFHVNPRQRWVNSRSMLLLLAMLREQDVLAFLPFNAVRQFVDTGLLAEIEVELKPALPPLGVLFREQVLQDNPGAVLLVDALAAAGDLSEGVNGSRAPGAVVKTRRV